MRAFDLSTVMTRQLVTLFLTLLAFGTLPLVRCGAIGAGGTCSPNNTHVDPSTHKLITECDDKTFCTSDNAANGTIGTCQPRGCRRDEFPFGYGMTDALPPLCDRGTFCPDDGHGCEAIHDVGAACELARDEQCAPPKDEIAVVLASNQNSNGAICLNSVCMWANATLGQGCVIDDTTYVDTSSGTQLGNRIIRHNCRTPLLYCDPMALQCFPARLLGEACEMDMECRSHNCAASVCADPPGTVRTLQPWHYVVTILVVAISMGATATMLVMIHQRLRLRRHRELREYYYEQLSLRQSMFALHRRAASKMTGEKSYYD